MTDTNIGEGAQCALPFRDFPHVLMAHGGGGRLMQRLLETCLLPAFSNPLLNERHDGAVLPAIGARMAFTTDAYVVRPLFFPGGDIGSLAVNGTVNDLAMCGARPLYLSVAFILEEGTPTETVWRVAQSMRAAAKGASVQIVTGDTKVVDRGRGDQIYISTSGVGVMEHTHTMRPSAVLEGDVVIVSGDLGRHGIAILSVREGLSFESEIQSDCAPISAPALALLDVGLDVRCMRDCTRGGLAAALHEIAAASKARIEIEECAVPIGEDVRGACEILGLDPWHVANEGRFVVFVGENDAPKALETLRSFSVSANAAVIGRVQRMGEACVLVKTRIGTLRIVDMPSGEQLPRIC